MSKRKSEMTPEEFRRMLEKMTKRELHQFIKDNKQILKGKVLISPFSIKEKWISEIMWAIFGVRDEYIISKNLQKRNWEIGLRGASAFGHRLGSIKACMDRRIHEGVLIDDLAEELVDKYEMIKDEDQAKKMIHKHIFSLPEKAKISIILTLRPDPSQNHVIGVFDEMEQPTNFKKKKV